MIHHVVYDTVLIPKEVPQEVKFFRVICGQHSNYIKNGKIVYDEPKTTMQTNLYTPFMSYTDFYPLNIHVKYIALNKKFTKSVNLLKENGNFELRILDNIYMSLPLSICDNYEIFPYESMFNKIMHIPAQTISYVLVRFEHDLRIETPVQMIVTISGIRKRPI